MIATAKDVGLTRKDVYEARTIRDAEKADPGVVRRTLDERLAQGEEPSKAALRAAVEAAAKRGLRGARAPSRKNPLYRPPSKEAAAWTHVYGACRQFVEWATKKNIALAMAGLRERDDDQASNIRAVRECASMLAKLADLVEQGSAEV